MINEYPGSLFIVAAPSGGGKTSLVKKLISNVSNIEVSISHTTRKKRPGEEEGIDYYFVKEEDFAHKIAGGDFVEYARVFNHYYGTSKAQIYNRLRAGKDVVLDIDWQGAQQIKQLFVDAVSIFVVPPSLAILKQRLMARRQDDEQVIKGRMQRAQSELSHYSEFDYLIVNDDFNKASSELQAIVIAHRLRMGCQTQKQRKLLSFLLAPQ
ncbi:guanylate kinase [Legionella nagasakiensis]|uniref:guanylate kinase n=1 Tax=Legionella nagasakiensis TaxID=535290 RepID=UPI0010541777|nr:guanylate kinase [Legionella nagasakiensis]